MYITELGVGQTTTVNAGYKENIQRAVGMVEFQSWKYDPTLPNGLGVYKDQCLFNHSPT